MTHRDTTDGGPYRSRYVAVVKVRDPRPDRRFTIALLTWAALLDIAAASVWAKVMVGAFVTLALVIYCLLRITRPSS